MHDMVQKSTRDRSGGRGRPPSFDRDAVVTAAMRSIWTNGASATTLARLEAATGADRSTIYNSFGGKDGLLQEASAAYVEQVEEFLFAPMLEGTAGVDDLVEFLDRLADQQGNDDYPVGCFIVNDLTSADRDVEATDRYLRRLDAGVSGSLGRAVERGELDTATAADLAPTIVAVVIGANAAVRQTGPEVAAAMIRSARNLVIAARA